MELLAKSSCTLNGNIIQLRNTLRRLAAFIVVLALATSCAAPGEVEAASARPGPLTGPPTGPLTGPLASFHAALARGGGLVVLQLGDSHTANDAFSGRMRELLQARAGDGGRGMLPPGIPYDYYRPARVTVTSDGFRIVRAAPTGLAALRQHADGTASMTLSAEPGELARTSIELLTQPGGGTVEIATSDGQTARIDTAGAVGLRRVPAPTGPDTRWVRLAAMGGGPVDVLSWTALRGQPGATWSNLGTVGATMEATRRWDPAFTASETLALQPALIVLAFGTNEGFKDSTDLAAYPALAQSAIRRLRAAAPRASIVVTGPPGGVRPSQAGGSPCSGAAYAVPPNLPRVRAILRQVAAREGVAFWDWSEAMGGDCAMVAWSQTDPPMAAHDHVHLLVPGARATAEAFFAFLTR